MNMSKKDAQKIKLKRGGQEQGLLVFSRDWLQQQRRGKK